MISGSQTKIVAHSSITNECALLLMRMVAYYNDHEPWKECQLGGVLTHHVGNWTRTIRTISDGCGKELATPTTTFAVLLKYFEVVITVDYTGGSFRKYHFLHVS